jgi:hypothetical protein
MGPPVVKIAMETRNESGHPAYWVDGRQRLATCTSVRLIDERRLVCASLVGQALYLMEVDAQQGVHRVLDRVTTVCGGPPVCTDLLDFDGRELLATSNCEDSSVSFYRLIGDRLQHESDLRIGGQHRGFCHGVAFVPGTDLVCVAMQSGAECFQLWSRTANTIVARVADPGWMPKDATFTTTTRMLAVYSQTAKLQDGPASRRSKLALIEFSDDFQAHRTLSEWFPDTGHIDAISHSAGEVFVTDQGRDQVHRFRLENDLRKIESLNGFDFPHGVDYDSASGRLAVSNYGSNTIELREIGATPA